MRVDEFLKDVKSVAVEIEKKRTRYRFKVHKNSINIYSYYNFLRNVLKLPVTCIYQGEYRWLQVPFSVLDKDIPVELLEEWKNSYKTKKVIKKTEDKTEKEKKETKLEQKSVEVEQKKEEHSDEEIKMRIALTVSQSCISCKYLKEHPRGYKCEKFEVVFNIATVYTCDYFEKR